MIAVPTGVRIVVWSVPIDFRAGMDSLSARVQKVLDSNPFCGNLFIFRAKAADRVKILVWDGTGLWLHHKRLEKGRFIWPPLNNGVMTLSPAQLAMLLEGFDWTKEHPKKINAPTRSC